MSPDVSTTSPILRIDLAASVEKEERAPPPHSSSPNASSGTQTPRRRSRLSSLFHRHHAERDAAKDGSAAHYIPEPEKRGERGHRRLSQRLLGEIHHQNTHASTAIPDELLHVPDVGSGGDVQAKEQWEKHASQLLSVTIHTPNGQSPSTSRRPSINLSASPLSESGYLEPSKDEILANPEGANNSIAQVFYGLAKRHGWGCTMDPREAFRFLQMGAANAASLNDEAISSSSKRNGAYTKKILAMAIYELANCYKNAWGTPKDLVAARHYYETAANLGDTDAMCEAAWCFEKGCGGKKDKYQAAHYYRLARNNGVPMTGMSWIDKPAYQSKKGQSD
ncbi:atp4 subunit B of the stator stalk of mitochondrial F1F0 ATP synthase [Ascosphaera pollenicola]|nr:atp4 subunit B of the stator stalk of mitochondrial F1F0 ATP synthase [Ascosphaera pollenicola]